MKRLLFLVFTLLVFKGSASAQKVFTIFKLPQPPAGDFFSLYRTINVIDSRADTSTCGFLSRVNESVRPVVMRPDLQTQLAAYTTPDEGNTFILNLRRLEFSVFTRFVNENAYCNYQADYYVKQGDGYLLVGKVDTLFSVLKEADSVKEKIMAFAGKGIIGTLMPYLAQSPLEASGGSYTLHDIQHTDSLEKLLIPFYAAPALRDGNYKTATALYQQQPNDSLNTESVKIHKKDRTLGSYKYWDRDKKAWRVRNWAVLPFAVVYKGTPYILHKGDQSKYIPMERRGQDYYYHGKLPGQSFASTMAPTFGLAGYLAGAAVDAARDKGAQLFRLDYLTQKAVLANPVLNPKRK